MDRDEEENVFVNIFFYLTLFSLYVHSAMMKKYTLDQWGEWMIYTMQYKLMVIEQVHPHLHHHWLHLSIYLSI